MQQQYSKSNTKNLNPVLQSLSDNRIGDEDSHDYIQDSINEKQGDNSYYLNFNDERSLQYQSLDNNQNQLHYQQPGSPHQMQVFQQDDEEIEQAIFNNNLQKTSVFPIGTNLNAAPNYFEIDHSYSLDTGRQQNIPAEEENKARQDKIKQMLSEFQKKKDKVIKDQIKLRVGQTPSLQSTKNAQSKQIFFVDQVLNSERGHHGHQHGKQEFTVEDSMYKTKFQIDNYKKVCGTCKSMKQDITPKRIGKAPTNSNKNQLAIPAADPPMTDLKKLRQKFNTNEAKNSKAQNKTPAGSGRYATTHRQQELRDYSYDDLIKLIELLEKENADLKRELQDALTKLARMENRDDLILQYQNEIQLAKQRLNMNTQALKEVQTAYKLLLLLVADIQRFAKPVLDKPMKQKLTEIANRIKQITGGQEQVDKFDSVIQENSLQGIMQEMLQTKVKNMHQREILNLEKDFNNNLELMKGTIQDEIKDHFTQTIKLKSDEVEDKQEHIQELKEIKHQLKEELFKREDKIDELEKIVRELEDQKEQLEAIVKEADQGLQLKQQYLMLQQEFSDKEKKLQDKLKSQDSEKSQIKSENDKIQKENDKLRKELGESKELLKQLDELDSIKDQLANLSAQKQALQLKEQAFAQKERNLKLLQEQLEDLEERNKLIEKAKKKLEIDIGMQKQTKDKAIEQNRVMEDEINKLKEDLTQQINDKLELEQALQTQKTLCKQIQSALKDKKEFQKLEDLVNQVQSSIMLRSQAQFNEEDKVLIRELFGMKAGEPEEVAERINELKEENNQLYFELRNGYDHETKSLAKQKEYLLQCQDFAKAILTIDDNQITSNLPLTLQKRNKAPMYADVVSMLIDIQSKIDALELKQRGMDRLSMTKGMDKYDDYQPRSRRGSLKSGVQTPVNKKNKTIKTQGSGKNERHIDQTSSLYGTIPYNKTPTGAESLMSNPFGNQNSLKNNNGLNSSELGKNYLKDAVEDPQFIEELMTGINSDRNEPKIQVDRASRGGSSDNERLQKRQFRLKNQINDVLGVRGSRGAQSSSRQRTYQGKKERQMGSQVDKMGTLNSKNQMKQNDTLGDHFNNESGIYFFQNQEDIGNSFEVRVVGEGEIKSDLLQFIHCQALFLEDNKEMLKQMI